MQIAHLKQSAKLQHGQRDDLYSRIAKHTDR